MDNSALIYLCFGIVFVNVLAPLVATIALRQRKQRGQINEANRVLHELFVLNPELDRPASPLWGKAAAPATEASK